MSEMRFEEKILYKCRQHWIIPFVASVKLFFMVILPTSIFVWFLSDYSFWITLVGFFILCILILGYYYYLWRHSWLFIGNQKITLSVRNGLFSQFAMNIRYRNIRDSAVSKNNLIGFLLKYGTLFIRSTNAEGDFIAKYVPKVGKVYALVNALSRYSDDERTHIDTIEKLHAHHMKNEFSPPPTKVSMDSETAISTLRSIPGVVDAIEVSAPAREYIRTHEESRNQGVSEVLSRTHVICFIHNKEFRLPEDPLVHHLASGEVRFPPVRFPEIIGERVVSGSPGVEIHTYLLQFFPYASEDDATVLVGWDSPSL